MCHYKKLGVINYTDPKVLLHYRRYIFVVSKTLMIPVCFSQYLNTCHLHIMFTMETEEKPGSVAIFRVLEIMKAYVSLLFITPSY